jgi:hypothetical protein
MFLRVASIRFSALFALTFGTLFMTPAYGQSRANPPESTEKTVASAQVPLLSKLEKESLPEKPRPMDLEDEIAAVMADNATVREELSRMEEQQKTLLALVDQLQKRLNGSPVAALTRPAQPQGPAEIAETPGPSTTATKDVLPLASAIPSTRRSTPAEAGEVSVPLMTPAQPQSISALQAIEDRYEDGIVIAEAPKDAKVPFLLRFQGTTQVRYINTLDSNDTFTDHLGVTHDVSKRNDITVNRSMTVFGGYIFNKRAQYSFTVWTSAGASSIVVAGNIGWQFSKALTLTGGYTGVPGSRSLIGTFPFFTANDRTMADNFFRPGFTQGVWAGGQLVKGLNYIAFLGNGLNTLSIAANKIDTNLLVSGSLWWEPLGDYGPPGGRDRNMYDDYFSSGKVRIRLGTSFTRSRENRFSDLDQSSPENTSIYNSDGVQAFSTGAFAPGVTLQDATYKMSAIDYGIKWNGLAINGQYYMRWLDDFVADGPLPLASTFDHGGELSASYFVKPKKLMPYVRASWVRGQFANPYEYGGGLRWYYLHTDRLWLNVEVFHINGAPYSGVFTPYTAGMTGWVPMLQGYIAF